MKPHQKVQLVMQYVDPSIAHRLTIDQTFFLRGEMKRILYLPQCVSDSLFSARKRDGGLGFPKLTTMVMISALRAELRFLNSGDPLLRECSVDMTGRAASQELQLDLG